MSIPWTELSTKDEELFRAALHAHNMARNVDGSHWRIVCTGPDKNIYVEVKVTTVRKDV